MTYFRDNKAGSIPTIKLHLGIESDEQAGLIWDELRNCFAAGMPPVTCSARCSSRAGST